MSPRLPPLEPPFAEDVGEELRKLMPPGVAPLALFRTLAHNPRVLGRLRRGGLLDAGSITVRDREIIILRTTARCGAEYEWGVHVALFAAAAGLTDAQIRATVLGGPDDPAWSPRERALVAACDAIHDGGAIPDALGSDLACQLEPAQLVEVIAVAGFYQMVSRVVNALALDPEPFAPRLPEARSGSASKDVTGVVDRLYEAFHDRDWDAFRALCAPDVLWVQNPGFPDGATHRGADAIVEHVFRRFGDEWSSWRFVREERAAAEMTVLVLGHYEATHRVTGKQVRAAAAHVYDVRDGLVHRFRQYTDTLTIDAARS